VTERRSIGYLAAAAAALIIGIPIAFWPFLAHPESLAFFGYGDAWSYNGAATMLVDHAYAQGELPLWNSRIVSSCAAQSFDTL